MLKNLSSPMKRAILRLLFSAIPFNPFLNAMGLLPCFQAIPMSMNGSFKRIYYIVTGGGGAELGTLNSKTSLPSEVSASRYHFVQIQIEASVLELAVYDLEGELIDHLQIQK